MRVIYLAAFYGAILALAIGTAYAQQAQQCFVVCNGTGAAQACMVRCF